MTEGIEAKMEETKKYFEELYRYEEPDGQATEAMAEHYRDKILRNPHKCEGAILSENVLKQLVKAKTGKSPGPDLLPMEYYASHKDEIAPFLASYYNAIFDLGALPEHMREGIIALIFKNKGSKDNLAAYRPITLLNCDLKILTAILADRISPVMCEISDPDNSAAAPGRFISDNSMLLQIFQNFLDGEELPGYAIFLDWTKCFDLISHKFIHAMIEAAGFGPDINRWIHILYNLDLPFSRKVLVNGFLTTSFFISRSIAQGDSISSLLQVLSFESLSRALVRQGTL
jgi:hypothetical protein